MKSILSSILSILASWIGYRKAKFDIQNSQEIAGNTKARDEVKRQDEVEATVEKASQGHEQSLEDLRKLAAD